MNMADALLFSACQDYAERAPLRFHTPAHGGKLSFDPAALDLTELPDLDSLYESGGPIAQAEARMANFYGAGSCSFSAGGSTLCVLAMLAPFAGRAVLFDRNAHRSAVSACVLFDIAPLWLWPRDGRIAPDALAAALGAHPEVAAAFVTSPDYQGRISDIAALSRVCHARGVSLLADGAHGAHLPLCGNNLAPLALGADVVCHSAHKTLPAMTPAAMLLHRGASAREDAKRWMGALGSSSPSYAALVSLDLCRAWMERGGREAFAFLAAQVRAVRAFAASAGFAAPDEPADPARLALDAASAGQSGLAVAAHLRARGIQPEHADERCVILIPNWMHTAADFARLAQALGTLPRARAPVPPAEPPSQPETVMPPRQAALAVGESVDVSAAVGRAAAEIAAPCPPGIPVLIPGELIGRVQAELLQKAGIFRVKVVK